MQYGGINVECTPVEGAIKIAFRHYTAGSAAVLLVNAMPQTTIEYHQKWVLIYVDYYTRMEEQSRAIWYKNFFLNH